MKKPVKILVIAIAAILVLSFVKNLVIKTSIEGGVKLATGLSLKMRGLNVGIIIFKHAVFNFMPMTVFIVVMIPLPS